MKPCGFGRKLSLVSLVVAVTFITLIAVPAWSQPPTTDTSQGTASGPGPGMQVAALGATVLYAPFKIAYAIGGGIIGGVAYVFSGFSEKTAKNIWIPSMYGDYMITPEQLTGDRPIRFLGVADAAGEASATTSSPAPEPVQ